MGVVPGEPLPRVLGPVGWHVGPQGNSGRIVQGLVRLRGRVIGGVRRPPRQDQQKGLGRGGAASVAQVRLGVAGLGQGVVAFPHEPLVRVAGIVRRAVVVVGAFEHLPVLEALPPLGRNIARAAAAIDVPLADIGRVVAARAESVREARGVLA